MDTIRKQADKHGIDLEGDDPFVAAQTLLGDPFASLTKFQMHSIEEQPEMTTTYPSAQHQGLSRTLELEQR